MAITPSSEQLKERVNILQQETFSSNMHKVRKNNNIKVKYKHII